MSSSHKAVEGNSHGSGPTPMEAGLPNQISNGLRLDFVLFIILIYINTMGSASTQDSPVCSQHFINLFFNVPPEWWLHLQKVCHCHSYIIWSNHWFWSGCATWGIICPLSTLLVAQIIHDWQYLSAKKVNPLLNQYWFSKSNIPP